MPNGPKESPQAKDSRPNGPHQLQPIIDEMRAFVFLLFLPLLFYRRLPLCLSVCLSVSLSLSFSLSPRRRLTNPDKIDRSNHRKSMSKEEAAREAIKQALRALRKRHLLEEAAHAPALAALSRPFVSQGLEWKEKAESLEAELQQCYKAQSRLAEQLGSEVAETRSLKASLQEKEQAIESLERELTET
ncbi:hypothetical protein CRG98_012981, partial [Punica granatum]